MKGNPAFAAQFDIYLQLKYFTVVTATGVYTSIAATALAAGAKVSLPLFVFGNSDFAGGYKKLKETFALSGGWVYGTPFIFNKDATYPLPSAWDATVTSTLQTGDMIIPFTNALPGAGTTSLAIAIIRCNQVAYGTLLDALSSDRFVINMIRYILDDATKTAQFTNNLNIFTQSLFGKFDSDFVSPNSYKKPEQFQNGLIDVPLKWGVDKQKALATLCNYDNIGTTWSIFVWKVNKLSQGA
jgi:hypothetical protein